jgi:hypothetical protein
MHDITLDGPNGLNSKLFFFQKPDWTLFLQMAIRENRPICCYTKEEPPIGFLNIFEFSSPQHVKLYAKTETKGHGLQVVCGGAQVPASNRRTNSRLDSDIWESKYQNTILMIFDKQWCHELPRFLFFMQHVCIWEPAPPTGVDNPLFVF